MQGVTANLLLEDSGEIGTSPSTTMKKIYGDWQSDGKT